jgi:hypothetical protein
MTDIHYSMAGDGGPDDLPRTFRREREAREREAREREARERELLERELREQEARDREAAMAAAAQAAPIEPLAVDARNYAAAPVESFPAAVRSLDVPFLHLVAFFFKAVFAAIPALLLLAVLLWGFGHLLQVYFPSLVKMQILIWFPN